MTALAERLGEIELYSTVTLDLADGTVIEGRANPIDYTPDEHLRMEIRPMGEESSHRYEVQAHYEGEWETPKVRKVVPADGEEWNELGELQDFSVAEEANRRGDE